MQRAVHPVDSTRRPSGIVGFVLLVTCCLACLLPSADALAWRYWAKSASLPATRGALVRAILRWLVHPLRASLLLGVTAGAVFSCVWNFGSPSSRRPPRPFSGEPRCGHYLVLLDPRAATSLCCGALVWAGCKLVRRWVLWQPELHHARCIEHGHADLRRRHNPTL